MTRVRYSTNRNLPNTASDHATKFLLPQRSVFYGLVHVRLQSLIMNPVSSRILTSGHGTIPTPAFRHFSPQATFHLTKLLKAQKFRVTNIACDENERIRFVSGTSCRLSNCQLWRIRVTSGYRDELSCDETSGCRFVHSWFWSGA